MHESEYERLQSKNSQFILIIYFAVMLSLLGPCRSHTSLRIVHFQIQKYGLQVFKGGHAFSIMMLVIGFDMPPHCRGRARMTTWKSVFDMVEEYLW